MAQISKYPISHQLTGRIFELFLKTLIEIRSSDEAERFITEFLTPTEKVVLAKRITIALLLEKGYDYRSIQQLIHVSAPTIRSVNLALQYGNNGYRQLLNKIQKEEKIIAILDNLAITLLSAPAALEKGKGMWSYLKKQAEGEKKDKKHI